MDRAIIDACAREIPNDAKLDGLDDRFVKLDEIPYDFNRRRMSVLVRDQRGHEHLITKGAVEEMLKISSRAQLAGEVVDLTDELRTRVMARRGGWPTMACACSRSPRSMTPTGARSSTRTTSTT